MHRLALSALVVALSVAAAGAQTLRFETNVGNFDMQLNPTGDPNLQDLVDNILGYVALGRYHYSWINRAPEDFVLQMGGFQGFPGSPDVATALAPLIEPIERFDPVIVDADGDGSIDFDTTGLNNVSGTVSLALAPGDVNSGTSSFFINLGDNSQTLDPQGFVPFAEIDPASMATIDAIMALPQRDLGSAFGVAPGSAAFGDVPITADDRFVVITDVNVVDAPPGFSLVDPILKALGVESGQAAGAITGGSNVPPALDDSSDDLVVPEPTALVLAAMVAAGLATRRRRTDQI